MRKLALFVLVLAAVAAAFLAGTRLATREAVFAASADGAHAAWATERRCWSGACETLWIGTAQRQGEKIDTLEGNGRCTEIVWTKDGSRVAFLIDGAQLRFYDPATRMPAGQITLVQSPDASFVRGITFSDNGRAITFDDCPRTHSGCRAGFAAVPR